MRNLHELRALLFCLSISGLIACDPTGTGPTAANVSVTGPTSAIHPGDNTQLTAVVTDGSGNPINRPVTWSSSDPGVVSITSGGMAGGINVGVATISAEADGRTGTFNLEVRAPGAAAIRITPGDSTIQMRSKVQFSATVLDSLGRPIAGRAVAWGTSDPAVIAVDANGQATAVFIGSARVTASSGQVQGSTSVKVDPQPFAVRLSNGGALINPLALHGLTGGELWVAWSGNQFLDRFSEVPYRGLRPASVNLLRRNDAPGEYQGWYETTAPVVGTCLTAVQFDGTERRWADLSYWAGRPEKMLAAGHDVYKLLDDSHAAERLDALVRVYRSGVDRFVFFSSYVVPTEQISTSWKLVGGFDDWSYGAGRSIASQSADGFTFVASGLRRYTNMTAGSTNGAVWGLFGHMGDGSIDLSPASCTSNGSGFRDPDVHVDGGSAGVWFEAPRQPPEMPEYPPYRFVNWRDGQVWWSVPDSTPSNVVGSFKAATPWLSMVHDIRASETSWVEVDYLRLGGVVNGVEQVLASNDYNSAAQPVGGSLASRGDWFKVQTNGLASRVSIVNGALHLPLSSVPDSVWHVWLEDTWYSGGNVYFRHLFPPGTQRIWVETKVRVHGPAALQVGWDYYRTTNDLRCDPNNNGIIEEGEDGNCEGGKSSWYFQIFENDGWQVIRSVGPGWVATPPAAALRRSARR